MPTVLVVDDSATDRRLAGGLLEKNPDVHVVYAVDGKDAVVQMELHVPDLVVTDLQMPEMNGLELVKFIKDEYPLIPVVLVTAQGSEEIAVEALRQGAASYVPKKSLTHDLAETVENVLAASIEQRGQTRLMYRMTTSECSFVLENELSLIFALVAYLRQTVQCVRYCTETDHLRVGIALEEAMLNAYYHGNLEVSSELRESDHKAYYDLARQRSQQEPYCRRRIFVTAKTTQTESVYTIRDEGPGFDPSQLPDPTDPANLERPSGRGLLLMRTFMEEVIYNEKGNQVTLIKRRAPQPAEAELVGHEC